MGENTKAKCAMIGRIELYELVALQGTSTEA